MSLPAPCRIIAELCISQPADQQSNNSNIYAIPAWRWSGVHNFAMRAIVSPTIQTTLEFRWRVASSLCTMLNTNSAAGGPNSGLRDE
jgi:hypothetical protein